MYDDITIEALLHMNYGNQRVKVNVHHVDDIDLSLSVDVVELFKIWPRFIGQWDMLGDPCGHLEEILDRLSDDDKVEIIHAILNKCELLDTTKEDIAGIFKRSRGIDTLLPLSKEEEQEVLDSPDSVCVDMTTNHSHVYTDFVKNAEYYLYRGKMYKTRLFGEVEREYFFDHDGEKVRVGSI